MRIKAKQVIASLLALSMTFIALGCGSRDKLELTSAENLTEKYASKETKYEKTSISSESQKSYSDFALCLLR